MTNKCADCGAPLVADEKICDYCGIVQEDNSDQAFLCDLIELRRRMAVADAQNNKIVLRELIADDFVGNEIDEGEPNPYDRSVFFKKEMPDPYFFHTPRAMKNCLNEPMTRQLFPVSKQYVVIRPKTYFF